jgi:hypothetical protein
MALSSSPPSKGISRNLSRMSSMIGVSGQASTNSLRSSLSRAWSPGSPPSQMSSGPLTVPWYHAPAIASSLNMWWWSSAIPGLNGLLGGAVLVAHPEADSTRVPRVRIQPTKTSTLRPPQRLRVARGVWLSAIDLAPGRYIPASPKRYAAPAVRYP